MLYVLTQKCIYIYILFFGVFCAFKREEEEESTLSATETSEAVLSTTSVSHESKTTPPAISRTSSQNVMNDDEQTVSTYRIVVIVSTGMYRCKCLEINASLLSFFFFFLSELETLL